MLHRFLIRHYWKSASISSQKHLNLWSVKATFQLAAHTPTQRSQPYKKERDPYAANELDPWLHNARFKATRAQHRSQHWSLNNHPGWAPHFGAFQERDEKGVRAHVSAVHRRSQAVMAARPVFNERWLIESSNCGPRLGMLLRLHIHPHFLGLLCLSEAWRGHWGTQGGWKRGHPTRNIGTTRWAPTGVPLPSAAVIQPSACQRSHAACLRNVARPRPQ